MPGFFFSSRRRHTRWTGDWSSDVCSSDLSRAAQIEGKYPIRAELPATPGFEGAGVVVDRSEERRVGKECRSRWRQYHGEKERCRPKGAGRDVGLVVLSAGASVAYGDGDDQ